MAPESIGQQDLRAYARIFWRWKLLFLAFLVLIPLGAFLLERSKPKIYESSTLLALQGATTGIGQSVTVNNVPAVARLVTTTPIAHKAALFLHPRPATSASLLSGVSAAADTTTGFITITVQNHDPRRAAAIANAFARALGTYQTIQSIQAIDLQIRALDAQLRNLSRRDPSSRASVVTQLAQLRAQRGATGGGAQVVQPAIVSATPVGPQTRRSVELALVIALLLGVGAVLVAENSDRRLRSPEDLEELTKMPLLGTVPTSAFTPEGDAAPRDVEAFQMLRASLTYFNVDQPLSSVAIISPLAADGKTTVAVGLAEAVARAGKRAILVDADLRHPQACTRLGIAPTPGLGAVLSGERELEDMLVEHSVNAPPGGRLLVLPAGGGTPPPNPSALLSSQEMRELLRRLEGQADLVVVDTAAALAVSDSLPLLQTASGIVMIVRMNRSSRAAVRRLQKVIASTHGNVLGVVATGTTSAGAAYGDYYYAQNGNGRGPLGLRKRRRARAETPTHSSKSTEVPQPRVASEPNVRTDLQGHTESPPPAVALSPPATTAPNVAEPPGSASGAVQVRSSLENGSRTSSRAPSINSWAQRLASRGRRARSQRKR